MPPDSYADYHKRGPQFQRAWEILARGCEVPPSIEVFVHEFEKVRETRSSQTVEMFARQLVDMYRPVEGFFDRDA